MNIEELIMNGASDDEIAKAIAEIKAEKEELDRQAKEHEEKAKAAIEKDELKAEGRAYLINALLAYATAFDLVDEDGFSEEEIKKFESAIKNYEAMIPMWIKLAEMQDDINKDLFGGFGLGW